MKNLNQKEVWDKIAEPWQEFRTKIPLTVEKFLRDKKGKILDVGCGSGRNFIKIKGLDWYGVDFSSKMIEFAKKKANNLKMKVNLFEANAEDLSFEDNFFDIVLCYALIHCINFPEKRNKALQEIYRVLKKGGEALISSWGEKSPRLKNKEKECFIPWTAKQKGEVQKRYTYIYDLDELVKLCKEVGFEVMENWEERNVNVIVRKM